MNQEEINQQRIERIRRMGWKGPVDEYAVREMQGVLSESGGDGQVYNPPPPDRRVDQKFSHIVSGANRDKYREMFSRETASAQSFQKIPEKKFGRPAVDPKYKQEVAKFDYDRKTSSEAAAMEALFDPDKGRSFNPGFSVNQPLNADAMGSNISIDAQFRARMAEKQRKSGGGIAEESSYHQGQTYSPAMGTKKLGYGQFALNKPTAPETEDDHRVQGTYMHQMQEGFVREIAKEVSDEMFDERFKIYFSEYMKREKEKYPFETVKTAKGESLLKTNDNKYFMLVERTITGSDGKEEKLTCLKEVVVKKKK